MKRSESRTGRRTLRWIVVVAALAAAAVVAVVSLPRGLLERTRHYSNLTEWRSAETYRSRLVSLFPGSRAARQSALSHAASLINGDQYVLLGRSFTLSIGGALHADRRDSLELLERHLERVASRERSQLWRLNLLEKRAQVLAALGRYDQAMAALQRVRDGFEAEGLQYRVAEVDIVTVDWLIEERRFAEAYEAANAALESGRGNDHQRAELWYATGQASFALRNFEEAISAFERSIEHERINIETARGSGADRNGPVASLRDQPVYGRAVAALNRARSVSALGEELTGSVHGRVSREGRGIEGVEVFLLPEGSGEFGTSTARIVNESYRGTTDGEGRYRVDLLPPGEYSLILGFTPSMLESTGRREMPADFELRPGEPLLVDVPFHKRLRMAAPTGVISLSPHSPFFPRARAPESRRSRQALPCVTPNG